MSRFPSEPLRSLGNLPCCFPQILQDEKFRSEVLARTPMRRIGLPEEVAGEQRDLGDAGEALSWGGGDHATMQPESGEGGW